MGILEKKLIKLKDQAYAEPAEVIIYIPLKSSKHEEWACKISCNVLFQNEKIIFGVDENQAIELANYFLNEIMNAQGYIFIKQ